MAGIMFEKEATKISTAILNNDMTGLRSVLKDGEDPHHKDRKGNTYLHYVCTMHRPFIIHILVGAGVDVNAQNRHGNTALHVTALHHECCHVADLMTSGIDSSIKNKDGKTAAEIPTKNKFWKNIYEKYQPGIFEAVASHDVDKVLHLLHCWSRIDSKRNGKTLRQFAALHKFHDLVFHIDVHSYTLGAIYSILEGDLEKAWNFLSHPKWDINFLNYATQSSHILQHALKQKDSRLVDMICKARVNVNIRVTVQGYLKAPLFFAALDPNIPEELSWIVLKAGAYFTLKDERGRNAAIYALDKTKGKVHVEVIAHMLKHGLDISQRDVTGVTLRDVARFARRQDIVAIIDKAFVKTITTSNLGELERLFLMGYDSMLINFNHRDTFIYASGNETDHVLQFIILLPRFYLQVKNFHAAVCQKTFEDVNNILTEADRPDLLLISKDKGGRTALHLCILHWRFDILKMLLSHPKCDANAVDNLGRTAYHYVCAIQEDNERKEFTRLLEDANVDMEALDYSNHMATYNINNKAAFQWLDKERKTCYGMEKQLACVDKYEELCHIITHKSKQLNHFEKALCKFQYPVSKLSSILSPLMFEYRDLLFVALENGKEDIAVRLIQLGTNWKRKEFLPDKTVENTLGLMSVTEYAKYLKLDKVVAAIDTKNKYLNSRLEKERSEGKKQIKNLNVKLTEQKVDVVRKMACVNDKRGNGQNDESEDVFFEEVEEFLSDVDNSINENLS